MKRWALVVVLCLTLAPALLSNEWYSIDGFFLITGESIVIDAPSGSDSEIVEFLFDHDPTPGVRGVLVESETGSGTYTSALQSVIALVHHATFGQDEIEQIKVQQWPLLGDGVRLITVATEREHWLAAALSLGFTPGGVYSHLALVALQPADPDALLERLLNSLRVELANAAG